MDKRLVSLLVCPLCKGSLTLQQTELICRFDRLAFPIKDQIPVMLEQEARLLSQEDVDKL
ncbi:MAG TPA: tetraacyldisaccharide 4'-kinase [Legionellales bacterium]|nr:tetraacyldisaccharide 4'-kinase [Legionellales bacterium]HCA90048.1 tetraacyldisaccharide 4'-kinase [Legionellales bacterium]|tara:strand:- start:321 stop:500 length:180 start_codon:yes stop_codon:yes gene_type:complete